MSGHPEKAKDLVITCIKGEGKLLKFWALPNTSLDIVKSFETRFASLKQELDSSLGFSLSEQIPLGIKCVVKASTKQFRWCRAFVLAHQGHNAVLVRLLDYGNDEIILVSDVRNIEDPIMAYQPQAFECILADVMPVHDEWTKEAIKFCEQHLLYNTLSCYIVSEYMKLPVIRVAKKGESEAFVQRLINGGMALIKKEIGTPRQLSYKINSLGNNTRHLVRISFVENANRFYVQLSAAEVELKHLMDSINTNRLPKENYNPLKVPAINTPCLAMLSTTACYYRALITHIHQSQCKVFFVDYGFSEPKDIHELRAIPTSCLTLAAQAICCSLPNNCNFDLEEFWRLIGQDHLELFVLNRTNDSYVVKLIYRGQDVLMASQLPQNYAISKLSIGTSYEVVVSYVNDVSEFYCQPGHMKDQLDYISNTLNSGYNFLPISFNECLPGKAVGAKFTEDNLWYRAHIVKVNHENDIEVFFVDFGNSDNVSLSDIRKLGADLLKYPIQAFKCFLHETPLPTDSKARDEAFDLLEELTADQNLFATVNTFAGDAGYGITLYIKDSPVQTTVNERILSKYISLPVVPVNDIEDVYVTLFDPSTRLFFVQFEKIDSDKLTTMQDEINAFYSDKQNFSFVPKEGNLVCVRFHEDEQFYRGRVEQCKDRQCDVFFIDYGNRESIPLNDVHILDAKFLTYPQFGVECIFENFASQVPSDKLSETMTENSFKLKMIREEGDKWYVSPVENFPGNAALLTLVKQFEVTGSTKRNDEKFNRYQEKRPSYQTAHSDSWKNNSQKASDLTNNRDEVANHYHSEPPKQEIYKSPKSVEEFKDFSMLSIPSNACRNIYVSHIVSPGEFYCQIEEELTTLQLLMKNIEDIYTSGTDNLSLSNFVVDIPCCAVYEDGGWYRGKIKKVGVGNCDIFFVDYGNTDSVPNSKIKKLRNDLLRWPSQAVCCKVFNVSPKNENWNDDEINAFIDRALDKSFIAQFVECDSNNCYAVNLCSIGKLESNIFNKEFVDLGYGRFQDTKKSIIPLNPHAASTNLSFSVPDIQLGCSEAVQVFYGLNPVEIYCQLKIHEQEFKEMMIKMQNYYKNVSEAESLIDRPLQGMICAAQFSLDSAWYRAEIKKVETNKVVVFYVDYGNSEKVDRKNVKCIIQEYTLLPVQAIKCRIRGIKPPGKSWTINNNLGKYFEGNAVCKFISKEDDFYLVDLTCNQKDVSQLLIADGIAASDGTTVQIKDKYPIQNQAVISDGLKEKSSRVQESLTTKKVAERRDNFAQGQLLSVTISFIENPLHFWCQLLDESDILNELVEKIENTVAEYPSVSSSLTIGSYCMAQYSEDEAWYRARITSCESQNTYKVFFIDYGNSEMVSSSEMKMMPSDFFEQPPFCFECRLHNAPTKLLPEMTTLFSDTVADVEEITAKIENVHSGTCTVTLLFDKDDQEMNVNELLFGVKEGDLESGGVSHESPRFLPPDVPLGLHEGYTSVVKSPEDFYIQLSGTEDPLADLSEELAESSEVSPNVIPGELCVGYACSTQYSEDNNWYRAEVIEIQDSTVTVLFIDYGNIETVEKSTLKYLSEKHLQMPAQAIKCKLNGIVPVAEEWTEEAINTFQDMVLDACLGITFISKDIPALVNLTKDDKEVAQCLVDMELANFESCTEADEAYAEDHLAPAPIEDPLSSLPNDQSYPERKLSCLKHIVKICYVDSYDKFYITPLELSTELDTVSATLEILYDSPDSAEGGNSETIVTDVLEDPKISMPCVAKYTEDGKWYRAIITEIEEENIFVTFVDFGNSEISNLSNLRPLTPELLKIPPIALECTLFGIVAKAGKQQEITAKLEEYYLDEVELEVEIIENSPYKVKLFLNGEDVASSLIKEGLADELCILPNATESFVDSSKMTFVDESLEYKIQISKRFFSGADKIIGNVKFCEIENDLIVFHVVSTDLEDDLQDLQQKLQDAYCEPSQNLANFSCMDFCATKYMEDENWYRAQILSMEKDKIKVRFIDYGNCETVDKSDIYELLGDFTIEPQFSVKCILFGLKIDNSKEVELQNKLDEYVYHESVELKLCKHSHAVSDLCITSVMCGDTDITKLILEEKLVYPQYVINSHLDDVFRAVVQKIENNIVFLLPSSVIDEREAFQCKLQNLCKDLEKLTEVNVDNLCAAKVDDTWYRVSIVNISENEVTVDLVDFGCIKVIKISELVPLASDICHHPIFLQPCVVQVAEKSTGNAKIISIEDLSIGCEVSCELQKNYPLIQPLSVKIIEIHSSLKNIETKNENDVTIKDDDSEFNTIDDINVVSTEPIVDSEKEYFPQNEVQINKVDSENDSAGNELESLTEGAIVPSSEPKIDSEKEYFSQNEAEMNEVDSENYSAENESESLTEGTKVPVIEPKVDSEKECFSENELENNEVYHENDFAGSVSEMVAEGSKESFKDTENETENNEVGENYSAEDKSVSLTENTIVLSSEPKIDSEKEYFQQNETEINEVDYENYSAENESESLTEGTKVPSIEPKVDSEKECFSENELENNEVDEVYHENDFVGSVSEMETEGSKVPCSESFKDTENETENNKVGEVYCESDFTGNVLETVAEGSKVPDSESFKDTENEIYFSENENEAENELNEVSLVQDTSKHDSEFFNNDIISETQHVVDSGKDFSQNINVIENDQFDNISIEETVMNDSETFDCETKFSGIEPNVEFEGDYSSNSLKNNESDKLEEKVCVETFMKDKTNVEELNDTVHENSEMHEGISETTVNISSCQELIAESKEKVTETNDCESGNKKLSENMSSHEFDEVISDMSSENKTENFIDVDTNKLYKPEHAESDVSAENVEKGEKDYFTDVSNVVEDIDNTQQNDSFTASTKQQSEIEETFDSAEDSNKQCKTMNEHFEKTVTYFPECEVSESAADHNENSIDDEITSQLEHTEHELSNTNYDCTNDKNFEERVNSFEDTELKENSRGIEDSYQLTGLVPVKVSYITISDGSVIFAVQPLYLLEEFLLLKESIQKFYSSKAEPYDFNSENQFCVVHHEGEWCRGKILQSGHSTVLLLDYGECISADISDIKKIDTEHSNVPPFAVWCQLLSAICPPEKSETAKTFLSDKLKENNPVVKILEGGVPYKINMFLCGESILSLLLKNSLVIQKLPNMYIEPGSHKAKLSFVNVGTLEIFVNLSLYRDDYNTLFEDMQNAYKADEFVTNIVESSIYATFYNDFWYRGLVKSSGNVVQVYLVDTGETITNCKNLCILLPEHCLQPAFAVPCHIPFSNIQATNEICESINGVLKAAEFLVDIQFCPVTNSLSATLIDEQIMNEVKNIGLTCASTDLDIKTKNNIDISASGDSKVSCTANTSNVSEHDSISDSTDTKLSPEFSAATDGVQKQEIKEQFVDYTEETFTAEP